MAEVYWDLEWTMLQQGFDYAYDKRLYDRLREGHARPVREHLLAGLDFQNKLARFLENHDEPGRRRAFAPGHARGRRGHHVSVTRPAILPSGSVRRPPQAHLAAPGPRAAGAAPDAALHEFYGSLLAVIRQPIVRDGQWRLLECVRGLGRQRDVGGFIAWSWHARDGQRRLIAVNYAGNQSQCYVRLPFPELSGHEVRLKDLTGPASLRSRWKRARVARSLSRPARLGGPHNVFEVTAV